MIVYCLLYDYQDLCGEAARLFSHSPDPQASACVSFAEGV